MILSVSRRTDIPAFYSEWFMNRIRENFVCVRNPFNYNQVSKIPTTSENVDCIVFWTKNPKPMLEYLPELDRRGFKYYFQFTVTPYNKDLEPCFENKKDIINTFIKLSELIGKERVILRYDPILLTKKYSIAYHLKAFEKLLSQLNKYTDKVIISFIDDYKKVLRNMKETEIIELNEDIMREIAEKLVSIAQKYSLSIETCAEKIDLSDIGIKHSSCIEGNLIEKIIGCEIQITKKDKHKLDGNREACGCVKCIDIGEYNTCIHNCTYCYANMNKDKAMNNYKNHDKKSPILIGNIKDAIIKERNTKDTKSFKVKDNVKEIFQQKLF